MFDRRVEINTGEAQWAKLDVRRKHRLTKKHRNFRFSGLLKTLVSKKKKYWHEEEMILIPST